ncbi:protein of unknown function [Azospirillum lipoferum 4B]|uniref:Uncharacterized protein n=1 Tax=Azospirillum lipoferum (strain 4B) TaxID=862719 RepID=G7Z299_AZOL4|nr:protein of unknown function [Azospirillum lipoferum 4B]
MPPAQGGIPQWGKTPPSSNVYTGTPLCYGPPRFQGAAARKRRTCLEPYPCKESRPR